MKPESKCPRGRKNPITYPPNKMVVGGQGHGPPYYLLFSPKTRKKKKSKFRTKDTISLTKKLTKEHGV